MFSIFLITIISICWAVRLWRCVAFYHWSLLHCSHIGNFRLLSLHFQPLLARIDECRRFCIFIVMIVVSRRTSAFRSRFTVSWPMTAVLSMRSAWTTRATRHFTFVIRYSLASRPMSSAGSRVIRRLTFNWTRSVSMAGGRVSIARWSRPHGLWARIYSEQSTLLTLCPTCASCAAGRVGHRMMTVLMNCVVVESRRNTASGSVCIVNAVDGKSFGEFNFIIFWLLLKLLAT